MAACARLVETEPHDAARGYVVIADACVRAAELLKAEGRKDEALQMLKRAVEARRPQAPPG